MDHSLFKQYRDRERRFSSCRKVNPPAAQVLRLGRLWPLMPPSCNFHEFSGCGYNHTAKTGQIVQAEQDKSGAALLQKKPATTKAVAGLYARLTLRKG